jgi:hypothetical protein
VRSDYLVSVRTIGDIEYPYWFAASPDGVSVELEAGESLLWTGVGIVRQLSPKTWTMPSNTGIFVTDRRVVWMNPQFDKGGGWIGFGAVGLTVATVANVASKRRAAERSADKVLIGQTRLEWVTNMTLRRKKSLIGLVDHYVDLLVHTSTGPHRVSLWSKSINEHSDQFAHWIASIIAHQRLGLAQNLLSDEISKLNRYCEGGNDDAATDQLTAKGWTFPGDTDALAGLVWQQTQPE